MGRQALSDHQEPRIGAVFGLSVGMTTLAESGYFLIWGILLFPEGNLAGKAVWTASCGIAMGSVIGGAILLFVEGRLRRAGAVAVTTAIVLAVGSYCAWLCSRLDSRFGYFGGPEHGTLFLLAGIVPALIGGLLLGWLLYGQRLDRRS
jgi:hypothetical protein